MRKSLPVLCFLTVSSAVSCSYSKFGSSPVYSLSSASGNGGGYEGDNPGFDGGGTETSQAKYYKNFSNSCPDGVKATVRVDNGIYAAAKLLRENCIDLSKPKTVQVTVPSVASLAGNMVFYDGRLFSDSPTPAVAQVLYCEASDGSYVAIDREQTGGYLAEFAVPMMTTIGRNVPAGSSGPALTSGSNAVQPVSQSRSGAADEWVGVNFDLLLSPPGGQLSLSQWGVENFNSCYGP